MKKQAGQVDMPIVLVVVAMVLIIWIILATAASQEKSRKQFMGECLQDKKQYECDVLWSQTDASKQTRDLAIGIAAGAAIGAAAGRR